MDTTEVIGQQEEKEQQEKEQEEALSPPFDVDDLNTFVEFLMKYDANQATINAVKSTYNTSINNNLNFISVINPAINNEANAVIMSLKKFFESIEIDKHEVKTEQADLDKIIKGLEGLEKDPRRGAYFLTYAICNFFEQERLTKGFELFTKKSSSSSRQSIAALSGFKHYLPAAAADDRELDIVAIFKRHVAHCLNEYVKSDYYSPYFTLCQSSGYGKTRLIMEFTRRFKDEYSVVYICLRREKSEGWPRERSKIIVDLILRHQKDSSSENFWKVLISAVAKVVRDIEDFDKLDLAFSIKHQTTFWSRVLDEYEQQLKRQGEEKKSGDSSEVSKMGKEESLSSDQTAAGDEPRNKKTQGTKFANASTEGAKRKPILLVFDEASTLLSGEPRTAGQGGQEIKVEGGLFLDLRRALASNFIAHHVMAILLDTNSSLYNFQPIQKLDPSSRAVGGCKLLPPFYAMPPLLRVTSAAIESSNGVPDDKYQMEIQYSSSSHNDVLARELSIIYKPLDQLMLSRPLFASCALDILQQKPHDEESLSDPREFLKEIGKYVHFASSKLTMINNKSILSPERDLLDETMVLAILSPRCYLESTSLVAKSNLMKQHMGTCYWVNDDRSSISVRYPSEPALVAGSMLAVNHYFQSPGRTYADLFASFSSLVVAKCILYSPSGVGEMGELLAQLVLCQAHDTAVGKFLPVSIRFADHAVRTEDKPDEEDVPVKGPQSTSQVSAMPTTGEVADEETPPALLWRPLPLLAMLSSLFVEQEVKEMRSRLESDNLSNLCDAMVFSTHFIKISNYSLRLDELVAFLKRGASAVLANGEAGIDIVVPLMLPRMKEEELEKKITKAEERNEEQKQKQKQTHQKRTNKATKVQERNESKTKEVPVVGMEKQKIPMNVNDAGTFVTSAHLYQIKNWISKSPNPVEVIGQAFNHQLCRELLLKSTPFVLTIWNIAPVPVSSKFLEQQSILHVKSEASLSEEDSWRVSKIEETGSNGCYEVLIGATPNKKKKDESSGQPPLKKERQSNAEINSKILVLQMAGLNDSPSINARLSQIPCLSTQPEVTKLMQDMRRNDNQWCRLAEQQKKLNYGEVDDVRAYVESLSMLEWKTSSE